MSLYRREQTIMLKILLATVVVGLAACQVRDGLKKLDFLGGMNLIGRGAGGRPPPTKKTRFFLTKCKLFQHALKNFLYFKNFLYRDQRRCRRFYLYDRDFLSEKSLYSFLRKIYKEINKWDEYGGVRAKGLCPLKSRDFQWRY